MILRAKWVMPISSPPLENGAVAIAGDKIAVVGSYDEIRATHTGEVRDLGEVILLPGLINAHCHLDYSCMRGEVEWSGSFIEWILRIVALKKLKSDKDYARGFREGMQELLRSGVTTVVNIEAFPKLMDEFRDAPLRIIWCLELLDAGRPGETESIFAKTESFLNERPWLLTDYGFSPHAPYSTSRGLYSLATRAARARGVLLTTHLAESRQEDDMLRRGAGPMYDYFQLAGRDMSDCKHMGAVQWVNEVGVLGDNCLAAHVNCASEPEIKLLAQTKTSVAHCPKTHRFFHRDSTLRLPALWAAGINVCLGTDSLASNDRLNLFDEMRTLAHMFPDLESQQILKMATSGAARALRRENELGCLKPHASADLIAVRPVDPVGDPYESVVFNEELLPLVMVKGKEVTA